jgi:hypothetical protein
VRGASLTDARHAAIARLAETIARHARCNLPAQVSSTQTKEPPMRNVLSAILLVSLSVPAFASVKKHVVAEGAAATSAEAKPADTKSSAPASDSKSTRPRKSKRVKSDKSGEKAATPAETTPAK